jgi:glycosyltransferase involved in cell wall biosynthesis
VEGINKRISFTVTNDLVFDQRMSRICNSLHKAGYRVTLIGRKRKQSPALQLQPYSQKRIPCFFEKGKLFYIEYTIRLTWYLLLNKFDIYAAIDTDTLLPNTFISRIKSRKLVFDAHEYFTEVPELKGRKWIQKCWEWTELACIRHTHLRYTVSKSLAMIFTDQHHLTFHVIRNVPLLSETNNNVQATDAVILYQGDLNPGRGLEEILDCMPQLNATFRVAGDGPIRSILEEQIRQLGIENKVELLGYVQPDALRKLTAEATIGINLLSDDSLSYRYSLSNKFFNYMHAAIPQICADFPEYQLINAEYEVAVLSALHKESILKSIERLLSDHAYYAQLQANCRAARTQFNWQLEEQHLIRLYNEL